MSVNHVATRTPLLHARVPGWALATVFVLLAVVGTVAALAARAHAAVVLDCQPRQPCLDPGVAGFRHVASGRFEVSKRTLPCRRATCPAPTVLYPREPVDIRRMHAEGGFIEKRSSYTFSDIRLTDATSAAVGRDLRLQLAGMDAHALVEGDAWRGGDDGSLLIVHARVVYPSSPDRH